MTLSACGTLGMLKDAIGPDSTNSGTEVDTKLNVQHGSNAKQDKLAGSDIDSKDIDKSQVSSGTQYNADSITIKSSNVDFYILLLVLLMLIFWISPQYPLRLLRCIKSKVKGNAKNS